MEDEAQSTLERFDSDSVDLFITVIFLSFFSIGGGKVSERTVQELGCPDFVGRQL